MNIPDKKVAPMLANAGDVRKSEFRAALALAHMNQGSWAKSMNVSESVVSKVLSGQKKSERIEQAIQTFTRRYVRRRTPKP